MIFINCYIIFLKFKGGYLTKAMAGHSIVALENDLVIIGGLKYADDDYLHHLYLSTLYKMNCKKGTCESSEMEVRLNKPRAHFVSSLIPAEVFKLFS